MTALLNIVLSGIVVLAIVALLAGAIREPRSAGAGRGRVRVRQARPRVVIRRGRRVRGAIEVG